MPWISTIYLGFFVSIGNFVKPASCQQKLVLLLWQGSSKRFRQCSLCFWLVHSQNDSLWRHWEWTNQRARFSGRQNSNICFIVPLLKIFFFLKWLTKQKLYTFFDYNVNESWKEGYKQNFGKSWNYWVISEALSKKITSTFFFFSESLWVDTLISALVKILLISFFKTFINIVVKKHLWFLFYESL